MIAVLILLLTRLVSASNADYTCKSSAETGSPSLLEILLYRRPQIPADQGWMSFCFQDPGTSTTYSIPSSGVYNLTVTDAYCPGDRFWISINDSSILFSTSAVANTGSCSPSLIDPDLAVASGQYSFGSTCGYFDAGDKISITVRQAQSDRGKGFILLTSMPDGCSGSQSGGLTSSAIINSVTQSQATSISNDGSYSNSTTIDTSIQTSTISPTDGLQLSGVISTVFAEISTTQETGTSIESSSAIGASPQTSTISPSEGVQVGGVTSTILAVSSLAQI